MEDKNLSSLVTELQNGNKSVFEAIYYQTHQKLYVYALYIMKNENDAKELLQETYLEIIKSIKNLQSPERFVAWSKKILFHLAMQKFRKCGLAIILDEEYESILENLEETDESNMPQEAYDVNEVKVIMREIVEELPIPQRLSIIAYYYDEMNIKDIADMMECAENTVKTRIYYARVAIKNKLESYEKKHDISLHALTPLLLISIQGYDEVYAMPAESVKAVASKLAERIESFDGLTKGIATEAIKTGVGGATVKAMGSIAVSKIIAAVVVVVVALGGIGIASTINTPERTLQNFEKSFNKGDLDGVLDCINPETKTLYTGISGLASAALNIDVAEFSSSLFGLAAGVEYEGRISIDIVIENVEKNGDEAFVDVYMVLYQGKELYDSSHEKLVLNKIDGEWYIMK